MLNVPYNTILSNQYFEVEEYRKDFEEPRNIFRALCYIFSNPLEKKIDRILSSFNRIAEYSVMIKGVYSTISNLPDLSRLELGKLIERTTDLIHSYIKFKSDLERLLEKKSQYRREELEQLDLAFRENIDTLYDSLRLFKKANKKTPITTSQAAKIAVQISTESLRKVHVR